MLNKLLSPLALSFAALALPVAAQAETAPIAPAGITADADLREGDLSQQGALVAYYVVNELKDQNALVLDRQSATLHLIQNGQIIRSMPAIYGAGEGDSGHVTTNITNSGMAHLLPMFTPGADYGEKGLFFQCDTETTDRCDVIHETADELSYRLEFIADGDPSNNAASNGCIGLTVEDMNFAFGFVGDIYKRGGETYLFVTNINSDLNATAEFFNMSQSTLDGFTASLQQAETQQSQVQTQTLNP